MAKPSPVTTTIKPQGLSTQTQSLGSTAEEFSEIEKKFHAMKKDQQVRLFEQALPHHEALRKIEREFSKLSDDPVTAKREMLLLAIKAAGKKGLLLANARPFVPDPVDLTDARDFLKRTEDEDENKIEPVIKEVRGDNNELRLFLIEPKPEQPEQAEEQKVQAEA